MVFPFEELKAENKLETMETVTPNIEQIPTN
jgi:hypothetical protein